MKVWACAALVLAISAFADAQGLGAHATFGGSNYFYSWRVDGHSVYTWDHASRVCRSLGMGLVSLETPAEANFIRAVISQERVSGIWTSGRRSGLGWVWSSTGAPVSYGFWSNTGSLRRSQPDNFERNEFCLAVLNNVYRDGVTEHDVGCHHRKPFVCERAAAVAVAAAPLRTAFARAAVPSAFTPVAAAPIAAAPVVAQPAPVAPAALPAFAPPAPNQPRFFFEVENDPFDPFDNSVELKFGFPQQQQPRFFGKRK